MNSEIEIVKNFVNFNEDETDYLIEMGKKGTTIFNPDKKRRQITLKKTNSIFKKIKLKLGTYLKQHNIGGLVILHSKKGCKQQRWHTDYDVQQVHESVSKPYGVIIALQNDTKFETPNKQFILQKGDMLLFRGDIVHAGASYEKENTRIHVYLDVPEIKRRRNTTWFAKIDDQQISRIYQDEVPNCQRLSTHVRLQ